MEMRADMIFAVMFDAMAGLGNWHGAASKVRQYETRRNRSLP